MTTEPKSEGGPDWDMAAHWIDRYAAGVDEQVQLDRVCDALGCKAPPDDWFGPAAMAHPTPSAVEELARVAVLLREIAPHFWCDESAYIGTLDAAIKAVDTALAHPEIAALLKETKA